MKRKLFLALFLFFVLLFGLSLIGCLSSLSDLVGVWEGSYFAYQGETGLTLTVWKENKNYKATFYFYNLPEKTNTTLLPVGVDGSYYMNVTINRSTGKYNLVGYEWISMPNVPGTFSEFVDLEGTINGNVFSGNAMHISGDSGYTFRVVKK